MFVFLGKLIAFGIVSKGNNFCLDIAPLFWKELVGANTNRNDLKAIDEYADQELKQLEMLRESIQDEETFNENIDKTFTTTLSDG